MFPATEHGPRETPSWEIAVTLFLFLPFWQGGERACLFPLVVGRCDSTGLSLVPFEGGDPETRGILS